MTSWLDAIARIRADGAEPAVLVTIAGIAGSSPREPGASMLVTPDRQVDTIGGGHLEWRACEIARAMLADGGQRRYERFPLGPSLGQCCGGVVHLAFELLDADALSVYAQLQQRWHARQDSVRLVALDAPMPPQLTDASGRLLTRSAAALPPVDTNRGCHVAMAADGGRWLVCPCLAHRPHLLLFGAGHVGTAIVRAMAELPCRLTWVDEREEMFPAAIPANVTVEATDVPEAVVAAAEPGSSFLVMTHSHAIDQRLCEAILRRGDAGWFGLIGSHTKRMQFEHRLRERGITTAQLATMACPIGLSGITGKQPAVIAASVTAQLLQVWEAQASRPLQSGQATPAPTSRRSCCAPNA